MEPELSPADIAVLKEAVERALDLAAEHGITLEEGQLAALLCLSFLAGQRDPKLLAYSAIEPVRLLH